MIVEVKCKLTGNCSLSVNSTRTLLLRPFHFPITVSELIHNPRKTTDTTIISKLSDCQICVGKTFKVSDAHVQHSLPHLGGVQLSVSKLTTLT